MAFNTGLSGLRAASVDLDVTGNNIANASTVGFKGSKAQFGDLYASGFLSAGTNPIGDGVRVQDVKQSFSQGNISFTDNGLDLAINGDGFFVLNNGGEVRYSRAGQFGIDKDGFVTNNQNMRVQGFVADDDGNLSGIRDDLQVETDNLAPRRTTNLRTDVNLDSRESVLERRVGVMGEIEGNTFAQDFDPLVTDFPEGDFEIAFNDGTSSVPVNIPTGSSAKDVAGIMNQQRGLSASATTTIDFPTSPAGVNNEFLNDDYVSTPGFDFTLEIDGSEVRVDTDSVSTVQELAKAINTASTSSISATAEGNQLRVTDNQGNTVTYKYRNDDDTAGEVGTKIGTVRPQADRIIEEITGDNPFDASWDDRKVEITNEFNPDDQRTYNHATSTTIYDSLGNSHEMTQFYVKQPSPGNGVGVSEWAVYAQIDGELVGGTDQTPYFARFNQDGVLDSVNGDANGEILIADWVPKDPNGMPNGADGPPAPGEEITTPIPDPPTTSAFVLDLGNTTQYGSDFGVNDQRQNGYATGRLSGLDVSDQGVLFARYTNGQSQSLGQVALASFNNTNGLSPVGETTWVETFESGQPIIGPPDTGTLGSIKASSIEESNVDLSAELVNLIIAQRNYQANAKTIETSDAVTQTIINLR
ncbi:flagellar biosynthesis protein FlgE [Marinobacter vulgaris]|uniref:Flagellar hook protein FlgE n=1 Tax=Marinobacter vulgaris TaxID=1928331 RepID=A0A2V3ZL90_9GAMM|nr:flagellar hook protein FlgE [Marinobacter vulgaris]PXX91668.1 flagellar biosynthesis protein FlgE [Marinobacter vulgaris]TSJ70827.1 flagellar hook protein FlgE [Marinobacter vulgaris]